MWFIGFPTRTLRNKLPGTNADFNEGGASRPFLFVLSSTQGFPKTARDESCCFPRSRWDSYRGEELSQQGGGCGGLSRRGGGSQETSGCGVQAVYRFKPVRRWPRL